ncbi:MAG: DUF3791 domain-containing protein [Prevotellaceae bacterium]|nr:DUF3791 domain-containing protein [Prevotellaceae bacterium]
MGEVARKYSTDDTVDYIVFIVHEFAGEYCLTRSEAFDYLKEFKGIAFLEEHYGFEHTQNPYWTVKNLLELCKRNGGYSLPKDDWKYYE